MKRESEERNEAFFKSLESWAKLELLKLPAKLKKTPLQSLCQPLSDQVDQRGANSDPGMVGQDLGSPTAAQALTEQVNSEVRMELKRSAAKKRVTKGRAAKTPMTAQRGNAGTLI